MTVSPPPSSPIPSRALRSRAATDAAGVACPGHAPGSAGSPAAGDTAGGERRPGRFRGARRRGRDLLDALEAQGALVRAQLDSWIRPRGSLVQALPADRSPELTELPTSVVARVSRSVDRASRRGIFRPACLVRAMAIARLLERRGVHGWQIRVGVRRPSAADTPLDAHAWVEVGGMVVGDDPRHTGRYTPIGSVTVRS